MLRLFLSCLLIGTLGFSSNVQAQPAPSWPRFHGPKGDNISSDTGLLRQWPEKGPELIWKATDIGIGFSSPVIADGRIFIAGNRDDKTTITALDLDGKLLWRQANGPAWTGDYRGTRGSPTVDGELVYHESPSGNVICLEAASGKVVWQRNILSDFEGKNLRWALAESVLIDGDRLICSPGGSKVSLAALDKRTGENVWTCAGVGDGPGYASPVLAEHNGRRLILAMTFAALIGVDAGTGELLWRYEHRTQYDINATIPVYHDGCVLISSGYSSGTELLKIVTKGTKMSVERVWKSEDLDNQHGGLVVLDGFIYGSSHYFNGGKWVCLDWKTGKKQYAERGVGKGSLTCADGMLYTFSESNRRVGLVKASPKGHEVVSRFTLPSGGEGMAWAHPVVIGGRLYVRHGDQLSAYAVK